ncbi:C-C chemokine receptor type 10 [Pseudophryne corroboree]|uniref:C-C chemokine receptor type 10 n=1 Tax=Pseudophryne corroboree TaxID=495146 RepID=UPI003081A221
MAKPLGLVPKPMPRQELESSRNHLGLKEKIPVDKEVNPRLAKLMCFECGEPRYIKMEWPILQKPMDCSLAQKTGPMYPSFCTMSLPQKGNGLFRVTILINQNMVLSLVDTSSELTLTSDSFQYTTDFYVSSDYDSHIPQICDVIAIQEFSRIFQPFVQPFIFLIGICGNSLVLLTYKFTKQVKTMTDIYLINLAIADLLLLLTLPFLSVSAVKGWVFGNVMCKMMHGVYSINFFSGLLFLTCISVDRYIVIVRAVKAHTLRQRSIYYSKIIAMIVWVASVLLSLPELIYSESRLLDGSHICKMIFPEEVTSAVKTTSNIFQIILGFFIPFCVMVVCYSIIIKTLLSGRRFQKHKALKVILSLVLVFVIFQLPYTLVTFIETTDFLGSHQMTCEVRKSKDIAIIITSNLAFSRCCLNPILYAFIGVQFRNDILLLLKNIGCISRNRHCVSSRNCHSPVTMDTSSFTL